MRLECTECGIKSLKPMKRAKNFILGGPKKERHPIPNVQFHPVVIQQNNNNNDEYNMGKTYMTHRSSNRRNKQMQLRNWPHKKSILQESIAIQLDWCIYVHKAPKY